MYSYPLRISSMACNPERGPALRASPLPPAEMVTTRAIPAWRMAWHAACTKLSFRFEFFRIVPLQIYPKILVLMVAPRLCHWPMPIRR